MPSRRYLLSLQPRSQVEGKLEPRKVYSTRAPTRHGVIRLRIFKLLVVIISVQGIFHNNPEQEDLDNDLFGDACDNCPTVANYYQEDMDQAQSGVELPMDLPSTNGTRTSTEVQACKSWWSSRILVMCFY